MNVPCLLHHHWVGCRCERCGTIRDRDHDWNHCRCRRCGLSRSTDHDWTPCVCSVCGAERHQWVQGVCSTCGVVCNHTIRAGGPEDTATDVTAHLRAHWTCGRCGLHVSARRTTSAEEPGNGSL